MSRHIPGVGGSSGGSSGSGGSMEEEFGQGIITCVRN